jgi:adenylate cyclase
MAMNSDETSFPAWLPALVILAVAIAFIVADPAGLASRFAALEFGLFRALRTAGPPLRIVDSIPAQILFLETVGAALLLLIAARQYLWIVGVALVAALVAQLSSLLLFAHLGALFDMANASAAILLAALAGLFAQPFGRKQPQSRMMASRRAVEAATGKKESAPSAPAQAGEVLVLTSLSCGLRGASALARFFETDAAGFMRLTESVMAPLMEDAAAHGAWISQFDGAMFSAQWPAGPDNTHADQACDAAGRMIAAVGQANERLAQQWPQGETPCPTLEIGIGLTTGKQLSGPVRAQGRIEACLVAEDAATAERLRCLSDRYGSAAIVSEATCVVAQRAYAFLEIDFLVLDPGAEPVRLHALLGNALMRASPKFRAIATFHEHIFQSIRTRQWGKARGLIAQCRKISGASRKLYDLHLARIAWYEANPPPPDWDGAFRPPLQ